MSARISPFIWLTYVSALFFTKSDAMCRPSSCGDLHNIMYPFRLKGDPNNCIDSLAELSCEHNQTLLYLYSGKYFVKEIKYAEDGYPGHGTVRLVDPGLLNETCPSKPLYFLSSDNFSSGYQNSSDFSYHLSYDGNFAIFLDCKFPVDSPDYLNTSCNNSSGPLQLYSYVTEGEDELQNLQLSCRVSAVTPTGVNKTGNLSYSTIHYQLQHGFEISWDFYIPSDKAKGLIKLLEIAGWILGGRTVLGWFLLLCYMCYKLGSKAHDAIVKSILSSLCYLRYRLWQPDMSKDDKTEKSLAYRFCYSCLWVSNTYKATKKLLVSFLWYLQYRLLRLNQPKDDAIEEFLESYKSQMPTRYSFSDLKKMTVRFKEKLGHGGYGSVFKGMLSDGHPVAVKMLNASKGKGQDFINEVATIGRIHHVNVVHLIGFCSDGSKRALIYDFMENGSLDKYTFGKKDGLLISWDKMHEIAMGVARGIEYLHRGCDLQILHFDIKPHNILLDENLVPKISDFGLAKFYPRDYNTVV